MHLLYGPNHRAPKQNTLSDLVYNSPTATVGGVTNYNGISCWEVQVVVHDCLTNGLRMSTRVSVTRHIQDPVPLIKKSRESCPGGRFPPSFIYQ